MLLSFSAPSIPQSLPSHLPFSLKSTLSNLPSPKLLGTVLPRLLVTCEKWILLTTLHLSEVSGQPWSLKTHLLLAAASFHSLVCCYSPDTPCQSLLLVPSLCLISKHRSTSITAPGSSVKYLFCFHGFEGHSSVLSMNPKSVSPTSPFQWVSAELPSYGLTQQLSGQSRPIMAKEDAHDASVQNIIIPTHSGSLSTYLLNGSC